MVAGGRGRGSRAARRRRASGRRPARPLSVLDAFQHRRQRAEARRLGLGRGRGGGLARPRPAAEAVEPWRGQRPLGGNLASEARRGTPESARHCMAWFCGSALNHRYPARTRAAGVDAADHPHPGQAAVRERRPAGRRPRPGPGSRPGRDACRAAAGSGGAAAAMPGIRRPGPAPRRSRTPRSRRRRCTGSTPCRRPADGPRRGRPAGRRRSRARNPAAAGSPIPRPWSGRSPGG